MDTTSGATSELVHTMSEATTPHTTAITAKEPIPQPKPLPVFQNVFDIDVDKPTQSMVKLADTYGPVFRLQFPGKDLVVVATRDVVHELCDGGRFEKCVLSPLERLRSLAGDALFTAYPGEENWGKAHRILMPAFTQDAMRNYFDRMLDVGLQMSDRWARLGPGEVVDVSSDMTRLTLDVIALCGFDYRLNSFFHDEMHPFVDAMIGALDECMHADNRPAWLHRLMVRTRARYDENVTVMHKLVDGVIRERRQHMEAGGSLPDDLLGLMLTAADPESGDLLDDENIRNQVVTFLIAGHETTATTLSFALHYMMLNDDILQKARDEVDRVVGPADQLPTFDQLNKLTYLDRVLKETLRLWSPAPAFGIRAKETTLLDGRFEVTPDDELIVLLGALHRDPAVWDDPERFDPERFTPEAEAARPPDAWKPFGNGVRSCIGRAFAMQEAKLTLALLLQRFDFERCSSPELDVREMLTVKPVGFDVRPSLRSGVQLAHLLHRGRRTTSSTAKLTSVPAASAPSDVLQVQQMLPPMTQHLPLDARPFVVVDVTDNEVRIERPDDVDAKVGAVWKVLPRTPGSAVEAFARRLRCDVDQVVQLSGGDDPRWPKGAPLSLRTLLARHVDVMAPVSTEMLQLLQDKTPCPPEHKHLQVWLDADTRPSILDALAQLPSCQARVGDVLPLLPPLMPKDAEVKEVTDDHVVLRVDVELDDGADLWAAVRGVQEEAA